MITLDPDTAEETPKLLQVGDAKNAEPVGREPVEAQGRFEQ